jgi:hypothetical protein
LIIFKGDSLVKHSDWIEWNQVFKYDNFNKDTPIPSNQLNTLFSSEGEAGPNLKGQHRIRRNGVIIDNGNLI